MRVFFMLLLSALLLTQTAVAQNVAVTGKVTDESGEPLAGVSISVKGEKKGTTSDLNGHYSLKVSSANTHLVFQFLGMETVERKITGTTLNVTLKETASELVEILIEATGYSKQEKRLSTSSIVTLSGDKVLQTDALSLDNMLMGKVPGLTVIGNNSTPGAATKIRIRGVSSISGNREPLWVVDGIILDDPVPLTAAEINSLDNVNLIGNAISGLNPNDIESIDILKDAAATAIYGVRAANGVIVVTTKKGKRGRTTINYTGNFNLTQRPRYSNMHLMNSQQRIEVSKEIEERALPFSVQPLPGVGYEGALVDLYDRRITEAEFLQRVKRMEEVNTDWFGLLYHNALTQKHNVSVSGATDAINYYVSGAFTNSPDIVKGKGVKSYNGMMKLFANFSRKFTGQFTLRAAHMDKEYTHPSVSPYSYALQTSRAIPAYNEDGTLAFYSKSKGYRNEPLRENILHEMDHTGNSIVNNTLNLTAMLEWKPMLDLSFSATFGANIADTKQKTWFDEQSYIAATLRQTNYGAPILEYSRSKPFREEISQLPYGGGLENEHTGSIGYTARAQMLYTWRPNDKHVLSVNLGPEMRSTRYTGTRTMQYGYLPDRGETFVKIDPATWLKYKELLINNPDVVTNRLSNFVSFLANFTYSYKQKYIATFNMRTDASNKFGQDSRSKFLPIWSISGRWNIHNEKFLEKVAWINTLAIKASYGLQGNVADDQIPNMVVRFGPLDQTTGEYYSLLDRLPNYALRWEKNKSYNAAFELSILDNRFSLNVDYYYRKGEDQIISKEVSHTTGMRTMSINAGEITNKGLDLMITAVPVQTKNFSWGINLNGSRNVNRIKRAGLSADEEDREEYKRYLNGTVILNGNPIDAFYSYRFAGLNAHGYPTFHGTEIQEGDTRSILLNRVLEKSGTRMPLMQGGIGHNFRYKNWSVNLFFTYNWGNKVRLNKLYSDLGQRTPNPRNNMSDEFVNRWRNPGDEARTNIPVLSSLPLDVNPVSLGGSNTVRVTYAKNLWEMYNHSNIRVVSANNIRLRTASVTYRIPTDWVKRYGMSHASVRLEGNNLFLISSKKLKGQDPDQPTLGLRSTPPQPSYSLTVNLTL